MQKRIPYRLFLSIFTLITLTILSLQVSAQQGCCSSHGGICGCACCDGTNLSASCQALVTCENSTPVCTETTIGLNFCNNSAIYGIFQNSNCSTSQKLIQNCTFGCNPQSQAQCNAQPKSNFLLYGVIILAIFILIGFVIWIGSRRSR